MKLQIVAVGKKMPSWVQNGFSIYSSRFPQEMPLTLVEIPLEKRGKNNDTRRLLEKEGEAMLAATGKGNYIIALDIPGQAWNTSELSFQLNIWRHEARDISLLIGGPEGLSPQCKAAADISWSLSPLTLPHPIVRVLVAESLYRAWSLLINHPYHRE